MRTADPWPIVPLPVDFMNADHAEESRLLRRLDEALESLRAGRGGVEAVVERLSLLAVRTREHFLHEESAMREAGFPAYEAHRAEHDAVLVRMDEEVRRFREAGDADRLWHYIQEEVPAWFREHTGRMDAVTARFLAPRRT